MCGNAHGISSIQKRSQARRVKNNDVNKSVAPSETSFQSLADCNLLIPAGLGMYSECIAARNTNVSLKYDKVQLNR